jgi:hypothetical protein
MVFYHRLFAPSIDFKVDQKGGDVCGGNPGNAGCLAQGNWAKLGQLLAGFNGEPVKV